MNLKFYCRGLFTKFSIVFLSVSLFPLIGNTVSAAPTPERVSIENIMSQTRITVNIKNQTLSVILAQIEKQAKIGFVVKDIDEKNGLNDLTLNVRNVTVEEALNTLLRSTPYTYSIVDNTIMIVRRTEQKPVVKGETITVKGKIVDEKQNPVSGATVMVIGTSNGAITDTQGNFTLKATAADQLEIAFVGYITYVYKKTLENDKLITIKLETDVLDGGDVVVTGIFTKAKESYTGAVTTVTSKELQMYKGQNLLSTLKNIDPSLNVRADNNLGSNPNRLPEVTIRGNSSLPMNVKDLNEAGRQQLNAPLVIMDGFEIDLQRLMDFNDQDILSINILKDAAATAIYGSRGANGIIVVVTKAPAEGKLRINLKAGVSIEMPDLSSYNLLDAKGKLELERKAGLYDSKFPTEDIKLKQKYSDLLGDVLRGVDTYWLSQPVRTGVSQNYNLSLMGGNNEFRWSALVGYTNTQGAMKNSYRDNFSGMVTLAYTFKNVTFKNQISLNANTGVESNYGSFKDYAWMNPYWKVRNDKGDLISKYGDRNETNPLYNSQFEYKNQSKYTDIINNFSIDWDITKGLKLRGSLGISKRFSTGDVYKSKYHTDFMQDGYDIDRKGSYDYRTGQAMNYDGNITLVYNKVFNEKHQLYAGLDYSMAQRDSYSHLFRFEGYPSDKIMDVTGGLSFKKGAYPSGSDNISRRIGYTANVNYTYDNRYFVDGSYRLDGSSQFGAQNKFAPFWSAGLGWNAHNESFLKDVDAVNTLRIRGSIGETGSQQFQAYQAMSMLRYYTGNRYLNWNGAELMGLGNPNLKWQITNQINGGVDVAFFQNRLSASVDVYHKRTSGLVSQMDVTPSHGFNSFSDNVGETVSKGVETMLSGYIIRNTQREIIWSVTAKMAYNKDVITKLSDALKRQNAQYLLEAVDQNRLLYEGYSQNSIYAVRSLGIDPSTGDEVFLDRKGAITRFWSAADKKYMGVSDPKFRGNISTLFAYKKFSLNLSFGYHWGGVQYNQTLVDKVEVPKSYLSSNLDRRVLEDRWFQPGDIKQFKKIDDVVTKETSRFVMPDRAFELQSASIQYIWDSKMLREKAKISSVTFGVDMSDVFYVSSVKRERGISYPFARRVGFNVTLSF